MTTRAKLVSGFSWNTLTVVLQIIIQLIYTGILARLIAPGSFATMGVVLGIMGFAELFSQVGIGPALIQRKEVNQQHINGAFYTSVILGASFTLIFIAIAPLIADVYKIPELELIIQVVSSSFIISALAIVPRSFMIKEMRFRSFFVASMISIVGGNLVVGLTLAWLEWDIWAYIWALFAQNTLMVIAYWWLNPVRIELKWEWKFTRELIRYGSGSTLFNALNYAATKIDVTLVPFLTQKNIQLNQSEQLRQAGMYERSNYVMSLPITIMAKLSDNVLFSGMSKIQDEDARLRKMIIVATNLLSIIVIPSTIFIIFFSPQIIRIYLGPDYLEAIPILQVLFAAVIFRTLSRLCDSLLRAKDAVFRGSWVKAVYLIIMSVGIIFAVPFGMSWVAASIVFTTLIHYLMSLHLTRRLIQISRKEQLKALLPGSLLGALATAFSWLSCQLLTIMELRALPFLIAGLTMVGLSIGFIIFRYPVILGKREINPLLFIPDKLKKLPPFSRMIQRLE